MEKWSSTDVLDYWKSIHGHKFPKWGEEWDSLFLEHPAMKLITSVDASWIREAINEFRMLDSIAARIQNGLDSEKRVNDPSGLYDRDERGWW